MNNNPYFDLLTKILCSDNTIYDKTDVSDENIFVYDWNSGRDVGNEMVLWY